MNFKTMFSIGLLIGLSSAAIAKLFKKDKHKSMSNNRYKYRDLKVLFILKKRDTSISWGEEECYSYTEKSSGLGNSVNFSHLMLEEMGVDSKVAHAQDGNSIDKLLHDYRKEDGKKVDICIIEALWATPEKLKELKKLHKNTRFCVRIHSEVPFLSTESIATKYIFQYLKDGITVTANSPRMQEAIEMLTGKHIPITPNWYPLKRTKVHYVDDGELIQAGNFGAVRVLKNNLMSAIAMIHYCLKHNKKLRYFVNTKREEGPQASQVTKNLRELFNHYKEQGMELVEVGWHDQENFLKLMGEMNILLQNSMSETYNYVAMNAIGENVPVVGSKEIPFLPEKYCADPTDVRDIVKKIELVMRKPAEAIEDNFEAAAQYNVFTMSEWQKFLMFNK